MLDSFGKTQQDLLRILYNCKNGLTIFELSSRLKITRTAVRQHLLALEESGYLSNSSVRYGKGRPSQTYQLAQRGIDLFPKQYSWFSGLLLRAIKTQRGSMGLTQHLSELANSVVHTLTPRVEGKEGIDRAKEIVAIMNELSYDAKVTKNKPFDKLPAIEARNCVYHHLAEEFSEVCSFDLELLRKLSGAEVEHQECLVRGGESCRFVFRNHDKNS